MQKLCYGRSFVGGIAYYQIYIQTVYLFEKALKGSAVVFVARVYAVAEYCAVDVAGRLNRIRKYVLMLSLAEPPAFRIGRALLYVLFFLLPLLFLL